MTEEAEVKVRNFEWLYQADPAAQLDVRGVTLLIPDPAINCEPPSFVEPQAAVTSWKGGKAPRICSIHVELLKAGGNAVLLCAPPLVIASKTLGMTICRKCQEKVSPWS